MVTFFVAWLIPSVLSLLVWAGVWLTPPLIPVLFATIFDRQGRRVSRSWLLSSMVISAIAGVVFEVVPSLKGLFSGGTIPAFIASAVVMLIGVLCCRASSKAPV